MPYRCRACFGALSPPLFGVSMERGTPKIDPYILVTCELWTSEVKLASLAASNKPLSIEAMKPCWEAVHKL